MEKVKPFHVNRPDLGDNKDGTEQKRQECMKTSEVHGKVAGKGDDSGNTKGYMFSNH